MTTNELTGRELAVACAEAMGWTQDEEFGTWSDTSGEIQGTEEYASEWIDDMLAWLHERGDCIVLACYANRVTACSPSAIEEGATLAEALQRLVVAVAKRGSKSKETP